MSLHYWNQLCYWTEGGPEFTYRPLLREQITQHIDVNEMALYSWKGRSNVCQALGHISHLVVAHQQGRGICTGEVRKASKRTWTINKVLGRLERNHSQRNYQSLGISHGM